MSQKLKKNVQTMLIISVLLELSCLNNLKIYKLSLILHHHLNVYVWKIQKDKWGCLSYLNNAMIKKMINNWLAINDYSVLDGCVWGMTHDRAKGTLKLGLLIRSQRLKAEDTQRSGTFQL